MCGYGPCAIECLSCCRLKTHSLLIWPDSQRWRLTGRCWKQQVRLWSHSLVYMFWRLRPTTFCVLFVNTSSSPASTWTVAADTCNYGEYGRQPWRGLRSTTIEIVFYFSKFDLAQILALIATRKRVRVAAAAGTLSTILIPIVDGRSDRWSSLRLSLSGKYGSGMRSIGWGWRWGWSGYSTTLLLKSKWV